MNDLQLDEMSMGPSPLAGFSVSSLIAGIIFGLLGWAVFRKGKRENLVHLIIIGILMMIYPYFTNSAKADWLIGLVLTGLTIYSWNRDRLF